VAPDRQAGPHSDVAVHLLIESERYDLIIAADGQLAHRLDDSIIAILIMPEADVVIEGSVLFRVLLKVDSFSGVHVETAMLP
jgi:hypothetical protein